MSFCEITKKNYTTTAQDHQKRHHGTKYGHSTNNLHKGTNHKRIYEKLEKHEKIRKNINLNQ